MTRSEIESALKKLGAPLAAGDIDGWCERFAPDCSFINSHLTEPVVGRDALYAMAREGPKVDNRPEWIAIEWHLLSEHARVSGSATQLWPEGVHPCPSPPRS